MMMMMFRSFTKAAVEPRRRLALLQEMDPVCHGSVLQQTFAAGSSSLCPKTEAFRNQIKTQRLQIRKHVLLQMDSFEFF